MNLWRDQTAAWPVANPVVTCASVSDAGFPSNFVADPFIYVQVHVPFPKIFLFLYFALFLGQPSRICLDD